jgi:hypothetical protein
MSYQTVQESVKKSFFICGSDRFLFDSRVRVPDEDGAAGASTHHPGAAGAYTTSRRNTECLQDGYDYY